MCCADGKHCCPNGYTCDLSKGTCEGYGSSVPLLRKRPSTDVSTIPVSSIQEKQQTSTYKRQNVMCNDKKTQCADGSTCCMLVSKQYGCCPMANAKCCSDGIHCCPAAFTCNVSGEICSKGNVIMPLQKKVPPVAAPQNVICPDQESQCSSDSTCCLLESGQYGCCPVPKAVCCKDRKHCCPEGYACQTASGTCTKGDKVIAMFKKQPAINAPRNNVVCPDQRSECSSTDTCCMLATGEYGCCPIPKALCCSDKKHCCPDSYTCDTKAGTCTKGDEVIAMFKKQPAINAPQNVICPDQKSECPSGNTCCLLTTGVYGCCPVPNAVCCSDRKHCCREGYTCETGSNTCVKGDEIIAMLKKQPAFRKEKLHTLVSKKPSLSFFSEPQVVVCDDGASICPDGYTCCKNASGGYGCCPHVDAVCCDDDKHCCPADYTCELSTGNCVERSTVLPLSKKLSAIRAPQNNICPDGKSECASDNTCCMLKSGDYGCCPQKSAVCCSDKIHCCPSGYTCNTGDGTCTKTDSIIPLLRKQPQTRTLRSPQIVCPNGQDDCSDNSTCCELASGGYGCCPVENALCCPDKQHCCPQGYACDTDSGTCTKQYSAVTILESNRRSTLRRLKSVPCPDGRSECPTGNTCCKLASGEHGCCPQPNAVCCSDGKHCCPAGYTCDTSAGICLKGKNSVHALLAEVLPVSAPSAISEPQKFVCPGQTRYYCDIGQTCCKNTAGVEECCPIAHAVCCVGQNACCPSGYTCNKDSKNCIPRSKSSFLSIVKPQPLMPPTATPKIEEATALVPTTKNSSTLSSPMYKRCPDGGYCDDTDTCCPIGGGEYGCCPVSNAVCCSDLESCCPPGSWCVGDNKCMLREGVIPMLKKRPSISMLPPNVLVIKDLQNIICPDQESQCSSDSTCCKLKSGEYGCCPLPKALCCDDGEHCCPADYQCNTEAGTCMKGDQVPSAKSSYLSIMKLQPLVPPAAAPKTQEAIPLVPTTKNSSTLSSPMYKRCPDGGYCDDTDTCCPIGGGEYGCCPVSNAVCCSDLESCCPPGSWCVGDNKCMLREGVIPMLKKRPSISMLPPNALVIKDLQNIICPDQESQCSSDSTCCKLKSGEYGCCPLPKALCCDDGEHCCPADYQCNTEAGTCMKGDQVPSAKSSYPSIMKLQPLVPPAAAPKTQEAIPLVPTTKNSSTLSSPMYKRCPDGGYCDDTDTCCPIGGGEYGCCPVSNAVCCSDLESCCPPGSWCVGDNKCMLREGVIPMLKKRPSISMLPPNALVIKDLQNIICPDQESQCSSDSTCCKLKSGEYGCCPLPKALCCDDGEHCCPADYQCNAEAGTCTKGDQVPSAKSSYPSIMKLQPLVPPAAAPKTQEAIPLVPTTKNSSTLRSPMIIPCPDGNYCNSSQTCCPIGGGKYGCCPVSNAVCCSDLESCCPPGSWCVGDNKCMLREGVIPMLKKRPSISMLPPNALVIKDLQNIICPDQESQCSSDSTCCKLKSGEYGCCPLPKALCCDDGEHCCPADYQCNTEAGTCMKGDQVPSAKSSYPSIMKLQPLVPPAAAPKTQEAIPLVPTTKNSSTLRSPMYQRCPDGSYCDYTDTCCEIGGGEYGCCPYISGDCCSDLKHCCPAGSFCWSDGCLKPRGGMIPMLKKRPSISMLPPNALVIKDLQNVICPDQESQCSTDSTCCKLKSGEYGCCPLPKALCCDDGQHCCPEGYDCQTSAGTCTKGDEVIAMFKKQPAIRARQNVVCPDQKSECSPDTTCCKLKSGEYGCCPIPKAVCCSDGEHCCPATYECDTNAGTCTKGDQVIAMFKKQPAINAPQNIICPDQKSECSSGNTCCLLTSGHYGCCPMANAVCCNDGKHCCPNDYSCDSKTGKCIDGDRVITMFKKQPAIKVNQNVVCPDQKSECSPDTTCCPLKPGEYGCCPIPKALCCEDKEHCCPESYTCNTNAGTCTKGDQVIAMFKKQPAIRARQNVVCPDQKSECSPDTTCCKLKSGEYGCCPIPNAKCCSDDEHCCPATYECDTNAGTCTKGDEVIAMFKKQPAIKAPRNVICPDQKSECPSNSTCCLLASGVYGCCPLVNAVCCSDGKHCCPSGFTCQVSNGTCIKGDIAIPTLKKQLAIMKKAPQNIVCPDKSSCPSKNTCCKLKSGQYGCCPQVNAVCCTDGEHCCPTGFTCQVSAGTCSKGDTVIPFLTKLPAATAAPQEGVIKCPDNSFCPDKNTCCQLESGRYGCCPQVDASCCSDKEHCCPEGYNCQITSKKCTKGNSVVPMLKKLPSFSTVQNAIVQKEHRVHESQKVICPDKIFDCPDNNTCCLTAGAYRCCPGTNAVCCGDRIHCCPEGFTCHIPTKTCTKGDISVPMLRKLPSISNRKNIVDKPDPSKKEPHVSTPLNVICPDQSSQCPNMNTCCQIGDTKDYRCCPTPDAVCCPDNLHCCRKGYTCNMVKKSCDDVERDVAVPFMESNEEAVSIAPKDDVIAMLHDVL